MSRDRQDSRAVSGAAEELETELRRYHDKVEILEREGLDSEKSLRRAAQGLIAVQESEERLRQRLAELVEAIGATRERQQASAERVLQCAQQVQQRTEVMAGLLERWQALGDEAAAVAELAQRSSGGSRTSGTNGSAGDASGIEEVERRLTLLVDQARGLAEEARAASFDDVVKQAEGMRQQVLASLNKLRLARGRDGE